MASVNKPIELIAHRGSPATCPENSLAGISAAHEAGARFIEFDVQLTADRVPVLLHDADLQRTMGVAGTVTQLTLAQVRDLSMIPTLAQAVELLRRMPTVQFFVDVKNESIDVFGAAFVLKQVLRELGSDLARATITSGHVELLKLARHEHARIALVATQLDSDMRRTIESLRPEFVFSPQDAVAALADSLWAGPWRWAIYGVENIADAQRMAASGAQYIETKTIGTMIADALFRVADREVVASDAPGADDR